MKHFLTSFKAILVLLIFSGNALAIGFNGTVSVNSAEPTLVGGQFSIDIFADDLFPATDAGDFSLDFGTAGVLAFNSFSSPFDTIAARTDLPAFGDVLFFVGASGASKTGNFEIGTVLFDVIGDAGSMTSLLFSDGPSGWSGPGGAIPAVYETGYVQVVPVPAAVWFMLSAIGGLGLLRKKVTFKN